MRHDWSEQVKDSMHSDLWTKEESTQNDWSARLHALTLPRVLLSIEINSKILRVEVNDGWILQQKCSVRRTYMHTQRWFWPPHLLDCSWGSAMCQAGSCRWQQETLPSVAPEVWTAQRVKLDPRLSADIKSSPAAAEACRLFVLLPPIHV